MLLLKNAKTTRVYCTQRNKFFAGDTVELLAPSQKPVTLILNKIFDENGNEIETANHAMMNFSFESDLVFPEGTVIRKQVEK